MKQNQLTQLKVKNAKPGHYADGMGLYLQVSETGTRSWVYRFMLHGRQREMGLGSVATFSLVEARERARQYRQLVHDGIDPIEQRRDKKGAAKKEASGAVTLKEASEEYYRLHSQAWGSDRHRQQWKNSLKDHASMLFNHPVSAIDSAVIHEALAPIWTKIPTTAKRVKNRIEVVCKWIKDGRPLPTNQVKQVKHHAALPFTEVPAFVGELRGVDSVAARALEFLILTTARTKEVTGAKWSEIEGGVWTVPASRMKVGKEHRVPLSQAATTIIRNHGTNDDLIFPGLTEHTLLDLITKMKPGVTVHGFRSSFRDWCGDRTKYSREVIEHDLAHKLPDKVEASYRRGTALDNRRQLMESWGTYCSKPVAEGELVQLPLRKAK